MGGGGLIRAYGKATTEALEAAGIVERCPHLLIKTSIGYGWLGKVENEVRQSAYPLKDIQYAENVELLVYVPVDKEDDFIAWITEITNGQAATSPTGMEFLEFPSS